jgi:colanic acid/amylovoran biosynthesis glycosyltransferase
MAKVAQFKRLWLSGTETAIHNHVNSLRRFDKLVFADTVVPRMRYEYPILSPPPERRGGLMTRLSGNRVLSPGLRDWYCLEMLCADVELMHVHFGTDGVYYRPLSLSADVPMIVSFHGHDVYRFPKAWAGLGSRALRGLFRTAAKVTAVSDHMRERLVALGCSPHKVETIRVGIDLARFAFRPPKVSSRTRITCIAGLRPKKGLSYLVEAFRRAQSERGDLELYIVGEGPLRPELERRIADAGLQQIVRLTGHLPPDEVAELLAGTHIYAQPSVTAENGDMEGIPSTVMEAMARGLPVVATRHSGIPELVQDGVTGWLVAERDIDALTERLLLLAGNPSLWEPMGAAGRQRVENRHDLARQTAVVEELYASLMPEPTSAAVPIGRLAREKSASEAA